MSFQDSSWNVSVSSFVILAGSVFEILCRRTDRHTNKRKQNPTPAVGVGKYPFCCTHLHHSDLCFVHYFYDSFVIFQIVTVCPSLSCPSFYASRSCSRVVECVRISSGDASVTDYGLDFFRACRVNALQSAPRAPSE